MRQRTIKLNISPTVNRHKFDLELTTEDGVTRFENTTRANIHEVVRKVTNMAFDSFD